MTQNEYNEIACSILKNDWDEKSTIQTGKFNISQFQGTAFDSNYACYRVNWSEWATTNNVLLAQKNSYSMVVKITGSTEENILKMLWKNGFPVPKVGAVLRYNNGTVILFMERFQLMNRTLRFICLQATVIQTILTWIFCVGRISIQTSIISCQRISESVQTF